MMREKSVICIPYAPVLGKPRQNIANILSIAARLAQESAEPDAVVFPELALTGYVLESLTTLDAIDLPQLQEFASALAHSGVPAATEWIVGTTLREGNAVFNAAVVISKGKVVHLHRKIFLPTYGMFDEGRYFAAGQNLVCYDGQLGKTAILICEDAWHPELAYVASAAKTDSVVVISASPGRGFQGGGSFESTQGWLARLKTYAVSYGQVFVYCNRSGVEDGILFDGNSFCLGHDAAPLASAEHTIYQGSRQYAIAQGDTRRVSLAGSPAWQNEPPPFDRWTPPG